MGKRMGKYFVFLALFAIVLSGCNVVISGSGGSMVTGSGVTKTEVRAMSGFSQVQVGGGGEVTVVNGDKEGVTIEADDNILPLLESEVRNGVLVLGPKPNTSFTTRSKFRYTVTVKEISGVNFSGGTTGTVQELKGDSLSANSSGGAQVKIGSLTGKTLTVNVSGGGGVEVTGGSVTSQAVEVSGGAKFVAGGLQSGSATVNVSGGGRATLWVKDSLKGECSGGSTVEYYGSPSTSAVNSSGGSNVKNLGNK